MTDPHYPLQGFRILPATELFDQDEGFYLSLSTEMPTKTDSHEVSAGQYSRIKWEGSGEAYTWPAFLYESEPYLG